MKAKGLRMNTKDRDLRDPRKDESLVQGSVYDTVSSVITVLDVLLADRSDKLRSSDLVWLPRS